MVIQGAAHKEEAPPEVSPSEVGVTPITFGFVVDNSIISSQYIVIYVYIYSYTYIVMYSYTYIVINIYI